MALMPTLVMRRNGPTKTEMDTETTLLLLLKVMPATLHPEHPIRTDSAALIPTEMGIPMVMQRGPQLKVQMHSRTSQVSGPTKTAMATVTMPVVWMRTIVQPHSEPRQNSVTSVAAIWITMGTLTQTMPSQPIQHSGVMQTETVMETRVLERIPTLVLP